MTLPELKLYGFRGKCAWASWGVHAKVADGGNADNAALFPLTAFAVEDGLPKFPKASMIKGPVSDDATLEIHAMKGVVEMANEAFAKKAGLGVHALLTEGSDMIETWWGAAHIEP